MKSFILALLVISASTTAHAQMAGALGKPLTQPKMPDGRVTVRLFDGDMSKALTDHPVQLISVTKDFAPEQAIANAQGRATFNGLPKGTKWFAQVVKGDDKSTSEPFSIPEKGGIVVMLSPSPVAGQAMANASSQRRTPPRRIIDVYVTRAGQPVANTKVKLLRMRDDEASQVTEQTTNAQGVARFNGLELSPRFSYTAFAKLPSRSDPMKVDRLQSQPVTMPAKEGVALFLDGSAMGDKDMLPSFHQTPGPNELLVGLYDPARQASPGKIRIIDHTGKEILTQAVEPTVPPSANEVILQTKSSTAPTPAAKTPTGTITVTFEQLFPNGSRPLPRVEVSLSRAGTKVSQLLTPNDGKVEFANLAPAEYAVTAGVFGKNKTVNVAVVAGSATTVSYGAQFRVLSGARIRSFSVNDGIYFAQFVSDKGKSWSPGFQMVPGRGASLTIVVGSPLFMAWNFNQVSLDDRHMVYSGSVRIDNPAPMPFRSQKDGVLIPFPSGYVHGAIPDEVAAFATHIPQQGVLWRGALPPGATNLRFVFSIKTETGAYSFRHKLPWVALQYNMNFVTEPQMEITMAESTRAYLTEPIRGLLAQTKKLTREQAKPAPKAGEFYHEISFGALPADHVLAMDIDGLPRPPRYQRYAKLAVGAIALFLFGWVLIALFRSQKFVVAPAKAYLYDELVELERRFRIGKVEESDYIKSRDALRSKLRKQYQQELDNG